MPNTNLQVPQSQAVPGDILRCLANPVLNRTLPIGCVVLILAGFISILLHNVVNLPFQDDFVTVLGFITKAVDGSLTWADWLAQSNEHRLVWLRLLSFAQYLIGQQLDFRVLSVLGSVGWIAVGVIVVTQAIGKAQGNWWVAVPIAAILAAPGHIEAMLWTSAGVTIYWELLFALGGIAFASRGKRNWACAMSAASMGAAGGALLLFPTIACWYAWQRKRADLLWWIIASMALVALYFTNYAKTVGHPALFASGRTLIGCLTYGSAFLGSCFSTPPLAVAFGALLAILLVVVIWGNRQDGFLVMTSIFILATAAILAWTRSPMGIETALSSRYAVYPQLAVATICMAITSAKNTSTVRLVAGFATSLLAGIIATGIGRSTDAASLHLAWRTEFALVLHSYPSHGHIAPFLIQSRDHRIYDGWEAAASLPGIHVAPQTEELLQAPATISGNIDIFDGHYIQGWAFLDTLDSNSSDISIVITNERGWWRLPVLRWPREDVDSAFHGDGHYLNSGYRVWLGAFALPVGVYRIGVLVEQEALRGVQWSNEQYSVAPASDTK